jgi:hypothetical protein
LVPNTQKSRQTVSAAEVHIADGQFLLKEQTFNIEKFLICRAGIEEQQFPKEKDRIYKQGKHE